MSQNAQAMVRVLGKPSYFLTITCNPDWPEIKEALPFNQQAQDRPIQECRVFKLKLDALMPIMEHDGVPVISAEIPDPRTKAAASQDRRSDNAYLQPRAWTLRSGCATKASPNLSALPLG